MHDLKEKRNTGNKVIESVGDVRKCNATKVLSLPSMALIGRNNKRSKLNARLNHSEDKELINNGLQKLVSTLNNNHRIIRPNNPVSKLTLCESKCAMTSKESVNCEPDCDPKISLNKQVSTDKYTMTDFNDIATDIHERELLKRKLDKESTILIDSSFKITALYYFCTVSISLIGTVCGIMLITLILSNLVEGTLIDGTFWNYRLETPKNEFILRTYFNYGVSSFYYILGAIMSEIMNLLTLLPSTNQILGREEEHFWQKLLYK